jgi:hypothetical protein
MQERDLQALKRAIRRPRLTRLRCRVSRLRHRW